MGKGLRSKSDCCSYAFCGDPVSKLTDMDIVSEHRLGNASEHVGKIMEPLARY